MTLLLGLPEALQKETFTFLTGAELVALALSWSVCRRAAPAGINSFERGSTYHAVAATCCLNHTTPCPSFKPI